MTLYPLHVQAMPGLTHELSFLDSLVFIYLNDFEVLPQFGSLLIEFSLLQQLFLFRSEHPEFHAEHKDLL